jgi:hypothetical protein
VNPVRSEYQTDRRPQGWDLNLGMVRDDLANAGIVMLELQPPALAPRLATAVQHGPDIATDGVQSLHPELRNGEPVDNLPDEVRQLHPAPGTGCGQRGDGVQPAQQRGAVVAPEPPTNHPGNRPPPPGVRANHRLPAMPDSAAAIRPASSLLLSEMLGY